MTQIGTGFTRSSEGMRRAQRLIPVFVKEIPVHEELSQGQLYISMQYGVIVHYCPCRCGSLSELTLAPERWRLTYDGETVSLSPSVGNSRLKCRSHYWIENNRVIWCRPMSTRASALAQKREDRVREEKYRESQTACARFGRLFKRLWRRRKQRETRRS